ncbi:MAG: Glu-tRNA(Gln) amidotransferase subunit GatE [Nanoarchaeota archaeon]|nr:Glu-tRNA(Gln) amidotransferase subunit GatE [Nanoarchaeota archaeon]
MEKEPEKINYKELGLKSGLEIHQQLNTNKLFCNCPSILRNDNPLFTIKRKLNPVIGETGDIDIAAEYEKSKNKTFNYEVYDTNCLVELDEEPPHNINLDSLKIALEVAILTNCKIFPVTQIMRKTVIDGSNTSGFQRTVLIAHEGYIETSEGRVGIETIGLEEDAARIISSKENETTYRLDRLGIPLIEIATKPDLKSPEQIKEAALKIGEILRMCDVKRGIGTIRQDLNISIKNSKRVEIKGFQEPKIMIKTVELEVKRQLELVNQSKSINEVRKSLPDGSTSFLRPMPGAARMYPETDCVLLKISRDLINEVKKTLPQPKEDLTGYLKKYGLNDELIKLLVQNEKVEEFKYLVQVQNYPNLIAKMLIVFPKEIAVKDKKNINEIEKLLNQDILEAVLNEINKTISENDVKIVLQKISEGKKLKDALTKEKIDISSEIEKLIKEKPGLSMNGYMGLVMAKFKGQVSGKEIMDELKKRMK